jgi:hypothetical protein
MNGNVLRHAQWNLRASWILEKCLSVTADQTEFHKAGNPLRALEAALFMGGYDLGATSPCGTAALGLIQAEAPDEDMAPEDSDNEQETVAATGNCPPGWEKSKTLGHGKDFYWTFDAAWDGLRINRGLPKVDEFSTTEVFYTLHRLYDQFGSGWFPLANNVEKLKNGTERDGFGTTIYGMTPASGSRAG